VNNDFKGTTILILILKPYLNGPNLFMSQIVIYPTTSTFRLQDLRKYYIASLKLGVCLSSLKFGNIMTDFYNINKTYVIWIFLSYTITLFHTVICKKATLFGLHLKTFNAQLTAIFMFSSRKCPFIPCTLHYIILHVYHIET